MAQYIDKSALVAEIDNMLKTKEQTSHLDNDAFNSGRWKALKKVKDFLDTLEAKDVNIAEMADDYYDALMEEAADWMDEGTMGHCRLAYYTGCKDVLNKLQKGE